MGNGFSDEEQQLRVPITGKQAQKFFDEITKFVNTFERTCKFQKRVHDWTDVLQHYVKVSKDMQLYFQSVLVLHKTIDSEEGDETKPKDIKRLQQSIKSKFYVHEGTLKPSSNQGKGDNKSSASDKINPSQDEEDVPRKALEAEIASLHADLNFRKKQVEEKENENEKLRRELATVTQRLSEEWNAKVAADERNLENINIQNRPQNVALEYEFLCSNAWLDAKSSLDSQLSDAPNHDKLKLLSDLVIIAANIARGKHSEMTNNIYAMISLHAEKGAGSSNENLRGIVSPREGKTAHKLDNDKKQEMQKVLESMPLNVKNAIGDFLRTTADNTDISAISEEVIIKLHEMLVKICPDKKDKESVKMDNYEGLVKYLELCARIGWKMAPQRPPMEFDDTTGIGQAFKGKEDQELYYSSDNPKDPGSIVKYYVYPNLLHGETVMVKGKVYVGKK